MWIVAYTLNEGPRGFGDFWVTCETRSEAKSLYDKVLEIESLKCAAMAPISRATEPHWMGE